MSRKALFILALIFAVAQGAWAQATAPLRPVSAADVRVTAVNDAYFTEEGIVVKSPSEITKSAQTRRRVSGMTAEGGASLTGARLYSYTYPSVDADGNEVMLSSLMAVPTRMLIDNSMAKPNNLIVGCHITITSNYECPTEYNKSGGIFSWKSDVGMLIDYTRYDAVRQPCCLVILPDYEGYGVTKKRAHPYLYQELTARQVVDAVRYGLALYNDNKGVFGFKDFERDWKTVCIGYSQGGSVSLATHRFIEENGLADELHFAGSVCADGPYDPVAHLGYYLNDDGETYDGANRTQHEKGGVSMPIVMPLILKGMCDSNPFMRQHQVKDYLSGNFLRTGVIDLINAKSNSDKERQYSTSAITNEFRNMRANGVSFTTLDEMGNPWVHTYTPEQVQQILYKDDGNNVHGKLELIMTPACFSYFNGLSLGSPTPSDRSMMKDLHRALASNARVSGWRPQHRIAFYHSTYDTVVPYENLLSFIRNQDDLKYYVNKHTEFYFDGIIPKERIPVRSAPKPKHQVEDEDDADIYIYDTHTTEDHVVAGRDFYFMGTPSPDYVLMKWVIENHTMTPATEDKDMVTITLQNGDKTVTAEAIRRGSSILVGNGQNACISQYTEGAITIPGRVTIGGQEYNVEVNQLAFRLCDKLTEVTIGEGVSWIGDFAFVGCKSLQKVSLPWTLNRIGSGAFVNLPNLTEVRCASTEAPAWGYNDLFAYEGTADATSRLASQRTLYVPRASANKYRKRKYGDVGWADAFGLISEATGTTQSLEIGSFKDLEDLATRVNGGDNMGDYTIRLTADLILEGDNRNAWYALTPIGTEDHPFSGVFDGQGHTIKNVRTYHDDDNTVDDNVGLFGYTDGAAISNLILQNISLRGRSNVGVVVGNANYSMIHDVLVYEAVATDGTKYYCAEATEGNAGGLVGKADDATILDSYFYGKVKGISAGGGIVGESASVNVSDCAAGYSVEGITAGGIVGHAGAATQVARCYSRSTLSGNVVGGIAGLSQNDSESGISYCAYLDASDTLPEVSGDTDVITMTGNRLCNIISDMEGLTLQDLLGTEKWYYFQEDVSDCPVPASLADDYLVWAGMKDANGFIFAPNDAEGSSYGIVGYAGSATELVLPETYKGKPVTKVGAGAFKGSEITSMTIPNSITAIGAKAFADCADLYYFSMGEGVVSEYDCWLQNCPKVTILHVDSANSDYCSPDDKVLYDISQTRLIRCSPSFEGILTVPSTVSVIEAGAFSNCDDLTVVDLRETPTDWTVNRRLPTSPFYNASKYTLFIMNQASYAHNHVSSEPNVVNLKNGYVEDGYVCTNLYVTDRLGINLGNNHFYFNATSSHYDRQFGATLTCGKGEETDFVYQAKAYTLSLPYNFSLEAGQGARLYHYDKVITENGVNMVLFKEVDRNESNHYVARASHPYYLVVERGGPFTFESRTSSNVQEHGSGSQEMNGDYAFVGTRVRIGNERLHDASRTAYVLENDGNWHKVGSGETEAYVSPFSCYFYTTAESPAEELITLFDGIELADKGDNVPLINSYNGRTVSVTLAGRTLWKDGSWNTLCLPFDLVLEGSPLAGATLKTLESSEYDSATGTLTLNFTTGSLDAISAGVPYLVKWDRPDYYMAYNGFNVSMSSDIVAPTFSDVTVSAAKDVRSDTRYVDFSGFFSPVSLAAEDKTVLYLGGDNRLYYPSADMTVNACRAVFRLHNDLSAGDLTSGANNARSFVLNFGDEQSGAVEPTEISSTNLTNFVNDAGVWFDLQGRRLSGKPRQKGLYINNGKKTAIK